MLYFIHEWKPEMHLIKKLKQNRASPSFVLFSCRLREDMVDRVNRAACILSREHGVTKQELITAMLESQIDAVEAELGIAQNAA